MKRTLVWIVLILCISLLAACGTNVAAEAEAPAEATVSAASVPTAAPTETPAPQIEAVETEQPTDVGVFDLERGVVLLNSGYEMPVLGIGCFQLSQEQAENSVYWALQDGYRLIDTARIYGNEEGVGRGIQKAIDEGFVTREEIFVTTKMWTSDFDNGAEAIEASLDRLGLDYIDLMILHHSQPRNDVQAYQAGSRGGQAPVHRLIELLRTGGF